MANNGKRSNGVRKRRRVRLFEGMRDQKLGLPPGTPVHVGLQREFTPWASFLQYKGDEYNEIQVLEPDLAQAALKPDFVNWINIEGVHDLKLVQKISTLLDLHPLTQEDIVNTTLRPQFESFNGYFFFALKMLYLSPEGVLLQEHVSLVLKDNTVLTFQETPGDVFGRIRERIRSKTGKVRARTADYLIYMLIDSIVDGYYQVVDRLSERIDKLEEELRCGPVDVHLGKIFEIRREILLLRKNIVPVRDLLNKVQVEGTVFQDNTLIYLKDLSDHIVQVTESLNLSMDMSNVMIDTYHSMQNQRMNAVMKTLTMISTIFLPLNFIAGVYGMNFQFMPELTWHYGYPIALSAMAIVAFLFVLFFIRKGWLWENRFHGFRFRRIFDFGFSQAQADASVPSKSASDS